MSKRPASENVSPPLGERKGKRQRTGDAKCELVGLQGLREETLACILSFLCLSSHLHMAFTCRNVNRASKTPEAYGKHVQIPRGEDETGMKQWWENVPEWFKPSSMGLGGLNVTDNIMRLACKHMQNVEILEFTQCLRITNSVMSLICQLKKLVTLRFVLCPNVTDGGLAELKNLGQLRELSFFSMPLTDTGLSKLLDCGHLQYLKLQNCKGITNYGMNHIASMQLKTLLLFFSGIDDAGLKYLASSKTLKTIFFLGCSGITDDGLQHLTSIKTLTDICVSGCIKVARQGVYQLQGGEMEPSARVNAI